MLKTFVNQSFFTDNDKSDKYLKNPKKPKNSGFI